MIVILKLLFLIAFVVFFASLIVIHLEEKKKVQNLKEDAEALATVLYKKHHNLN